MSVQITDCTIRDIQSLNINELTVGKYEVDEMFYYTVQKYETKHSELCKFESHRKYVDIQFIVQGEELMEVAHKATLKKETLYDEENDVEFWEKPEFAMQIVLKKDGYIVLYPENAHKGCISLGDEPTCVKKVVGKIKID